MDELFSLLPIIIIFVVGALIRSAAKKGSASKQQGDEDQAQRPPVRQSVMSDIQRAFMMMEDGEDRPSKPPVQRPPVQRPSMQREGMHGRTEGFASHEGTRGRTEGIGSHEGTRGKKEGVASREGTHGTEGFASRQNVSAKNDNRYANVKISKYYLDEKDDDDLLVVNRRASQSGGLKLFENQNDFVKAVIYSEVLTRKSARR